MNQMSGGHKSSFTPKQGQYLAFIDAYTRVHRWPPAEWEMQRHFGVTPPSVHQMILTLESAAPCDTSGGDALVAGGRDESRPRLNCPYTLTREWRLWHAVTDGWGIL
jgi:hypothetical protein